MTATEIAEMAGVSESVVMRAAESCARRLTEWYEGDVDSLIADLQGEDAGALAGAALQDHVTAMRKCAIAAHTRPTETAMAVYQILKGRE